MNRNCIHPEVLRRFGRDPKIIFERDSWKCLICGTSEDLTIDHIDGNGRNSKHPNNDIANLQTLCRKCNSRKGGIYKKTGGKTGRSHPYYYGKPELIPVEWR